MSRLVECPVCNKKLEAKIADSHVNSCLDSGSKKLPVVMSSAKRPNEWTFMNSPPVKKRLIKSGCTALNNQTLLQDSKEKNNDNYKNSQRISSTFNSTSKNYTNNNLNNKNTNPGNNIKTSYRPNFPMDEPLIPKGGFSVPLAEVVRPQRVEEMVGQGGVVGEGSALRRLIEACNFTSLILWGPPGCGKTTLARVIAHSCSQQSQQWRFMQLSATTAGTADVRSCIEAARNDKRLMKRRTVLFIDEIHRFNKTQQDTLLACIEDGTVVFIGATTENPSFQVNNALLSRCKVVVLEKLSNESIRSILLRTMARYNCYVGDGGGANINPNKLVGVTNEGRGFNRKNSSEVNSDFKDTIKNKEYSNHASHQDLKDQKENLNISISCLETTTEDKKESDFEDKLKNTKTVNKKETELINNKEKNDGEKKCGDDDDDDDDIEKEDKEIDNYVSRKIYKDSSIQNKILKDNPENSNSEDGSKWLIEGGGLEMLVDSCDGDARKALNCLQSLLELKMAGRNDGGGNDSCSEVGASYVGGRSGGSGGGSEVITVDDVKGILLRSVQYDRKGDEHYNAASALQKSIRGSDDNGAIYWLARMLEGGEDPLFVARRLVVCASEDIGIADTQALPLAVATFQACHFIGMPECSINLAHCATYLARAAKSNESYAALKRARESIKGHKGPLPGVPLHLRNAPTKLMKDLGYHKGYKYNHAFDEPVEQTYLPDSMLGVDFFERR